MHPFAPLPDDWKRFLTRHLPIAIVVLALAAEGLALALDPVALRRHDLDLLALNVERPASEPAPSVVLVGDSVTQDILKTYEIGGPGQVANLTTNKASGLVGAYLLLKRYLAANPAPKHLLIASTPEFYTFVPEGETARVYVTSVFRETDEKAFLDAYLSGPKPAFEPAALNLDKRIGLKLLALIAPTPAGLLMGTRQPDPALPAQPHPITPPLKADILQRGTHPLVIPPLNADLLGKVCDLARQHGIQVHMRHAPIAESTAQTWAKTGHLRAFEAQRAKILNDCCAEIGVDEDTTLHVVPDGAMRDADHLVRHDWTNVYAVRLNAVVKGW